MQLPRRRQQVYVAATLVAVAALTLVKWPLRVSGTSPAFRPAGYAEARTLVSGIIERVLVQEGSAVARGAPLVQLRDVEQRAAREATAAEATVAERAAAAAASRNDPAEERLQRTRAQGLRREVALLDAQLTATTVRAPVSGVVLTARPEERLGARLQGGDLVVTLGRTDTLELEFGVPQREIERVAVGQRVHLRVDALPQRTFEGLVTSLGQLPRDTTEEVRFPVRALKPGMEPHVKVLTARKSLAGRLLRGPVRWLRLTWWRVWT